MKTTIQISNETWKKLVLLKLELNVATFEEVVKHLLERGNENEQD